MERISVVGIDGSGKSSTLEALIARYIGQHHHPQGLVADVQIRPKYLPAVWRRDGVPLSIRIAALSDRLALLGDRFNSRILTGLAYAAFMGFGYNHHLTRLVRKIKPDLVVSERDPAIDTAVYSGWYFQPVAAMRPSQRVSFVKLVLGFDLPQEVIYLDVEPAAAMRRIRAHLAERAWTGRKQRLHLHENPAVLHKLKLAYDEVLDAVASKGVTVARIDTTHASIEDVASALYSHILPHLQNSQLSTGNSYADSSNNHSNGHPVKRVLFTK